MEDEVCYLMKADIKCVEGAICNIYLPGQINATTHYVTLFFNVS